MKLFPTQEVGSLPKASAGQMALWEARLDMRLAGLGESLAEVRSRFNVGFLRAAGLDTVYDGEAHRTEMLEHPFRSVEGTVFVGHVRSFDNKYFRKAAVRGDLRLKRPYHSEEFRFVRAASGLPPPALKVPVTGPYTLGEWTYPDYYLGLQPNRYRREARAQAHRDLVLDLAHRVVRPTLLDLVRHGACRIQLDEPAVGTHPHETALAVEAFEAAVAGVSADISLHLCYSNYERLLPELLEARSCREWMWELANRDSPTHDGYRVLQSLKEYGDTRRVGLGVVDVHRDAVEDPRLVADRIQRACRYLGDGARIRVNPDCGLRTRSWDVIWAKLCAMVEGARIARQRFARDPAAWDRSFSPPPETGAVAGGT